MIKERKTNRIHIRIIEKHFSVLVIGFKGVSKKKGKVHLHSGVKTNCGTYRKSTFRGQRGQNK